MEKLLEIKNLNVGFSVGKNKIQILNNVSFDIFENEVLAIIGETGCGKSVMGSTILHLLPENAVIDGSILYKGQDITYMKEDKFRFLRGKDISAIPQSPSTSLDPLMKVGEQVSECITSGKILAKKEKHTIKERVTNIFGSLKLPTERELYNNYPCELSGGMCQRVLISMGVITSPNLLIVDEPTKAIDWALRKEVVEVLHKLKDDMKCSMMFITHDLGAAKCIADRVAVMYCGEVVEIGETKDVLRNPQHPYTKGLIASMPSKGFQVMDGFMPSFSEVTNGCKFMPRCKYKTDNCSINSPPPFYKNGHMIKCHVSNEITAKAGETPCY